MNILKGIISPYTLNCRAILLTNIVVYLNCYKYKDANLF